MWRLGDPQGNESSKVKYDIVPYTRGKGLDIGCGPYKTYAHFTGVDNLHHAHEFGWDMRPDVVSEADKIDIFATQSMDFVFSSHLLEHIENADKALKEWWRVIKPGGYLVLYLPHDELYPKCGTEGANPDHKHDLNPQKVIDWMLTIGSWDLVVNEVRDGDNGPGEYGNEYSFYQVYKKISHDKKKPVNRYSHEQIANKTACVVRYGGFGDMIQCSTVLPYLKSQGFEVAVMTTPRGKDMLKANPYVDKFIIQDTDQVPNNELGEYWKVWEKRFDKFINLSESVEGSMLAIPGRTMYNWPYEARRKVLNHNYLELTHDIAGIPQGDYQAYFYPTNEEKKWSEYEDKRINPSCKPVILWSLAGSSVHKTWPWLDQVLARIMLETDCIVVLTGDELCQILEMGWENEPRVIEKSGIWDIRQSLTFAKHQCDLVIGTETGLLNAVGLEEVNKIITLSHSSVENLTKHWKNTDNLVPKNLNCYPCHQMHYGFTNCFRDEETGCAECQVQITPDMMWDKIKSWYNNRLSEAV